MGTYYSHSRVYGIEKEQTNVAEIALTGWIIFCSILVERLAEANLKDLLEGPQSSTTIVTFVSLSDSKRYKADAAGYHPLAIDPFETTLSLSRKSIKIVLCRKYI
mmetsp:Transcript_8611/g.15623  ORF Transcript_8611/g.15623 Transcript_8611/m.15623 type:complete len:105 (-) Transcript_8611:504-818(-)